MRRTLALSLTAALTLPASAGADASPDRATARLRAARADASLRMAPLHRVASGTGLAGAVLAAAETGDVALTAAPRGSANLPSVGGLAILEPLRARIAAVSRDTRGAAAASALAGIAAEIERLLPALSRLAGAVPAPAGSVAGCDLADQAPAICVGGAGANTITGEYALVVDLGGNDVHRHAAGGADAVGGLPASITIDVAGDDLYETPIPTPEGARAVQGGAYGGGVGVLVDANGRDTYRATSTAPNAQALGQGFASAGAAMLADLGGDDDYLLEERTPGVATSQTVRMPAAGQGFGELGGLAIALDAGGDDTATVRSAPPGEPTGAVRHAGGFGAGEQGGVGLHADLAGTDSFLLEALDGTSPTSYGASARGFGFGFEGTGLEVGGLGDTERIARVRNEVVNQAADSAAMFAIAAASTGGLGALLDTGGNDRYVSDFASISESDQVVGDGCGCQGAVASARAGGGQTLAIAAGQAADAVLEDLQGNDVYETTSVTRAAAIARDDRTDPGADMLPPTAEAVTFVAGGALAPPNSQMVTQGTGIAGDALLLDATGNDTYRVDLRVESDAESVGSMRVPDLQDDPAGISARATSGELDVYMQAVGQVGGLGAIEDGAGDDTYEVTLRMLMTATASDRRDASSSAAMPVSADALMSAGYHDIYAQGIGVVGGAGFLHDELGDDTYRVDHGLRSDASATASREDVPTSANARTGVYARVEAMGAGGLGGYGELLDHGGTDRYDCVASSRATAVPETTLGDGNGQCQVLGGGTAFGWFEDLEGGAADVVKIEPPFPASQGTRGQGAWFGPGGAGVNA